jgi:hypothetical protein
VIVFQTVARSTPKYSCMRRFRISRTSLPESLETSRRRHRRRAARIPRGPRNCG